MHNVVAIIPAAGSGKRMQQGVNKQFLEIGGQTIIERTLKAFDRADLVDAIIVVTKSEEISAVRQIVDMEKLEKIRCVIEGGKERQDSIFNALDHLEADDKWILVHDGARPFVSSQMVDDFVLDLTQRNQNGSKALESLIMAVPSKDTVKRVDSGRVKETLKRAELWNVQTPQGFEKDLLVGAYKKARMEGFEGTDDASLVERAGDPVFIHQGTYENIKITTPDDLYIGEAILKRRGEV